MKKIPPHVLPNEHLAIALSVWSPFGSLTYDVYCPRCSVFLGRVLRTETAAVRLAGQHRYEYGLPTLPHLEDEFRGYHMDDPELF